MIFSGNRIEIRLQHNGVLGDPNKAGRCENADTANSDDTKADH